MLPIPAIYVIDTEGWIRSAFVEPDFTIREEPAQILAWLRRAASTSWLEGPAIQRQDLAVADCGGWARRRLRSRGMNASHAASDCSIASSAGAALADGARCALERYSDGSLP
jgi:hypothetical protein